MKRLAVFLVLGSSVALAQPKGRPAKQQPADPYAEPAAPPAPAPAPIGPPPPPNWKPPTAPTPTPVPAPTPTPPAPTNRKPPTPAPAPTPAPVPASTSSAPVDPYAIPSRVGLANVETVQGLLAVQRLDGWLLFDRDGENPIARRLVAPEGNPTRAWFYMIPARGQPVALVHDAEQRSFEHLAGQKLTYTGYRDLDRQLRALLKGVKTIALEYSPKAAVPSVSRVDAGTMEVIRGAGVQVRSSDTLVQYTKAIWGDAGRTAHLVAVHHLTALRKEALAFVTKQLTSGAAVTEYDVQQRIVRGMTMRGLVGPAPVVAAGANTADPYYVPNAAKTAPIRRGDLVVISLAGRIDKPEGIFAAHTWVAVADATVRDDIRKAFETATVARDQALALITDRLRKNRPITGAEVDQATRAFLKKAGYGDQVKHRTGHSMDSDLQGGGADLDDFEVRDTRILIPGTGFAVAPGLYVAGQFGVRTEVSVYLAPGGPEVTTPSQDTIERLLK